MTQYNELNGIHVEGHIKIFDPVSGETYINKRNAIHYEKDLYMKCRLATVVQALTLQVLLHI
jgi:hypothetical protein